jgi:outer membrane protein
MQGIAKALLGALAMVAGLLASVPPATAGSETGDVMIRVLGTVVDPYTDATVKAGGAVIPGAEAEVSTQFIPAATISYFFTPNIAAELFCCFAKHDIQATRTISALGEIADTWIFPPALTLQYHVTGMGALKPYVGIGAQYINFFDTGTGDNVLGAQKVSIDDAFGFTLQAGVDFSLTNGWYLNADVKKTWLDTTVTWHRAKTLGGVNVVADADVDPLIVSVGLGYRFNLFGPRAPGQ